MVYADETRPLLQGARLTAYELLQDNIPVTLICDNMAGCLMATREDAINVLPQMIRPDCTVLLKASRGMKMEALTARLLELTAEI